MVTLATLLMAFRSCMPADGPAGQSQEQASPNTAEKLGHKCTTGLSSNVVCEASSAAHDCMHVLRRAGGGRASYCSCKCSSLNRQRSRDAPGMMTSARETL